jgi:WD40 repeat protein/CRP-like cAMP-binding protein
MNNIFNALKDVSLFSELSDEMINTIASEVRERSLSAGEILFREGDQGDSLYFVLDGQLEIFQAVEQNREVILATLKHGEYFGEISLLDEKPRTASARGLSASHLLALNREDFNALLERHPEISLKLTRAISARMRNTVPYKTRIISPPTKVSDSGPTTVSETPKVRVFISYSRRDKSFVQKLHQAIVTQGLDTWVDWENIPLTVDWWTEIVRGIENADAFAFILTPDSANSRVCGEEIQAAIEKNKRLIPILYREFGSDVQPHPAIAAANWVMMRSDEELAANLPGMINIINTDLDWVQDHTRLQIRAGEWSRSGRDTSSLLRGTDLFNAEKWLAKAESIPDPKPTPLHLEYINASTQDTKTRQLTTRRQRIFLVSISFALITTLILSIIAFTSYRRAEENRQIAISAQADAETARDLASTNEALAQVQRATAEAASTAAIEQQQVAQIAADSASTAVVEEAEQREIAQTQQAEANTQRIAAEAAREEANSQRDLALSRQRAAQAFSFLDTEPDLAALLSLEAYNTSPSFEARSAILTILQRRLSRRVNPISPIPDQLVGVYSVALSSDGEHLAFGMENGNIVIWNYQRRRLEHQYRAHPGTPIWSLAFSPDGQTLASGGNDSYVRLWNVADAVEIKSFLATSPALSVSWSPDGTRIAAVAGPRVIAWTIADEIVIFNSNLSYALNAVDWSPDGSKIAAGSAFRWVFILSAETGDTIGTLKGHTGDVQSVAWAPDSNMLASGGEDDTVRLWDVSESKEIATLLRHIDQVLSVDFSQDGNILASGGEDRIVILWDVSTYQFIGEIKTNINSVQSVAFSSRPGDNYLATASRDKTTSLYEVITEQPLSKSLLSDAGQLKSLIVQPDGTIEALGNRMNNLLLVWQVDENSESPTVPTTTKNALGAQIFALSMDGTKLALGYEDGRIVITDWQTGETIYELSQSDAVSALAFSADGQTLASSQCVTQPSEEEISEQAASACLSSEIFIWNVNTGSQLLTLVEQQTGLILSLAFTPEGNRLASGSDNHTITLWDLTSGEKIALPLSRHRSAVTSLAFSLDGKTLASGSEGNTIILWDMDTNQPIGEPLAGATGSVLSLVFKPDGTALYSGDSGGTLLSWELNIESWKERVCSLAGRNLTPAEWSQFIPNREYNETCGAFE